MQETYPNTPPHVDEDRTFQVRRDKDEVVMEWLGPDGNGNGGTEVRMKDPQVKQLMLMLKRALAAVLLMVGVASAQTYDFTIDSQPVLIDPTGPVSDVTVSMVCDVPGVPTGGYQLCFAWNPDELNIFSISPLACDPQVGCAFQAIYFTNGVDDTTPGGPYGPGVGYIAVLSDFNPIDFPTFDALTPIIRFGVYSGPLATPGPAVISFVSGLDLPGFFDTVLQVSYTDDTGTATGYNAPDFPAAVPLVSDPLFVRGDANEDGTLNLVDCLRILEVAFQSATPPVCEATLDANSNGSIDALPDVIFLLGYLFQGGPAPGGSAICASQDPLGLTCPVGPCP